MKLSIRNTQPKQNDEKKMANKLPPPLKTKVPGKFFTHFLFFFLVMAAIVSVKVSKYSCPIIPIVQH